MNIIDTHFHYSKIESFFNAAKNNGVNYSKEGFVMETKENNIVAGVCMGLTESRNGCFPDNKASTPMNYDLDEMPDNFYFCAGINPLDLGCRALSDLEATLNREDCAGIKLYAGYYHYFVSDDVYDPVCRLALKYNLPIVIHSGSTYSSRGLLKYSHPLSFDELAVKYPDLKIVIAHFGNPWIMDTAELMYKHKNVYADLSGILEGKEEMFDRLTGEELYMNRFKTALIQADHYDRFLYGSDWPLAKMEVYIKFIKKMIPEKHWDKVFYENALNVFKKIKGGIQ
ncbi:MAG: amidohydrolase family protein [Candidatus Delongbacteria bacterium]|nr:amidohydrolase family protein [Candidatus Delongbacteria bacterium]MBN2835944.1 amidohydrolase family protein [Candidatus Delongbacteria bacterium]